MRIFTAETTLNFEEHSMRFVSSFLILGVCVAAAAGIGLAQPPEGKSRDDRKDASKAAAADPAFVEAFVARMMAFDKNKDGELTRDEITDQRLLRLFDRADTNKDGVVTREELVALATEMAAEQGQEGGGKGGPGKGFGGGPGGPGGFGPPGGGGPGGPGGFGGPPRPGQVLSPMAQEKLSLTKAQKQKLEALQRDVDTRLGKILTSEQKKQLKDMRDRGPGGFGGPGGPGGGGPGGPGGPGGGRGGPGGGPGGPGGQRPPGPPPDAEDEVSIQADGPTGVFGRRID